MTQTSLLRWLFHPGPRLSQRAMHAGIWNFTMRIVLRLFTTARTIILARILAPDDFGLMGIALLMMSLLETFTRTGFSDALIQRKGDIRPYLDTAWTVELLRSLALAGALALVAPFVGGFFGTTAAVSVVRVIAIAVLIRGLTNIGIVYLQKELEFQKRFLNEVAPAVAEVGVGIGLALALHNVWALVYGVLAASVVQVVVSYLLHPYRPRLRLQWAKARDLFRFGRWVLVNSPLTYLHLHLDDLIVGKALGATSLGLYQMAFNISQLTASEIKDVAGGVAFPAFSKLQGQPDRLRSAYFKTLKLTSFLSFPLAAGIFILAPDLVPVVLGKRWLPTVPIIQVLAIGGLLRSLVGPRGSVFQAIGRPDMVTKLQFVTVLVMAALIYPMTLLLGMLGTAVAVVLTEAILYLIGIGFVTRVVECRVISYLKELLAPGLCALVMVAVLFLVRNTLVTQPSIESIAGLVALGLFTYMGTTLLFVGFFKYDIVSTLRRLLAVH